ncbi:MAG: STAS domain-containing protein [Moorea sp. SIO2B7]|nr:STAS domain-containing protein [Moorena sp. SIO2B7]
MMIVIRPQSKLDLVGATTLQQKVERVANLASASQKTWVIDLERVNFINHFGLTALVNARRYASEKGCHLFLRNLKAPVELMLEIAQLNQEFEVLDNNEAPEMESSLNIVKKPERKNKITEVSLEITNRQAKDKINNQSQLVGNLQKFLSTFKSKVSEAT